MTRGFDGRRFLRELMCRQVRYRQVYYRTYGPDRKRGWEVRDIEPEVGWVVGATWMQTGERHPGFGPGLFDEDGGEPPSFTETGPRKLCYLVTRWPTKRPEKVPPEAVEVLPGQPVPQWPVEPSYFDASTLRLMSEDAKQYATRDERGRFSVPED